MLAHSEEQRNQAQEACRQGAHPHRYQGLGRHRYSYRLRYDRCDQIKHIEADPYEQIARKNRTQREQHHDKQLGCEELFVVDGIHEQKRDRSAAELIDDYS